MNKGELKTRKLVLFLHASLDGFVEGPNGEMDIGWVSYDADLEKHAKEILSSADTVLWGRGTYQMMHSYWPSVPSNPSASQHERNHAEWIERTAKIVFSSTLEKVEWNNSRLVKEDVEEEINNLKQQPGKDMVFLGSPRFAHHLMTLLLKVIILMGDDNSKNKEAADQLDCCFCLTNGQVKRYSVQGRSLSGILE
jgi:dihydrofolate reductase